MKRPPICLMLIVALAVVPPMGSPMAAEAGQHVLVLYDNTGPYGWRGQLYVQHLANLLSHFDVVTTLKPVESYTAGELDQNQTTFYLGVIYGNPLPTALKNDLLTTTHTFCWLGYNLWQVAWDSFTTSAHNAFTEKFGFRFLELDGSLWNKVRYKGVTLTRETYDDPQIGRVEVMNPALVTVPATCHTDTDEAPYIIRGNNLWYVADNPFCYVTMTDRYLAFCRRAA